MRTTFMLAASAIFAGASHAQQPPRPASSPPSQASVAVCPILVVDGKTIAPSPDQCRPVPVAANGPRPDGVSPPPAADPLARFLYPPELVMAHQEALGLTDKQRSSIQDAVKETQAKVFDIQFKMSAEVEKLQRLIQASSPDEPKVLDEVSRVLTLERDMKVAQMTLMVRIKSQLTEHQQAQLDQLRGGWSAEIRRE
jgi:Spy/CpxP family protein refolding chaperone